MQGSIGQIAQEVLERVKSDKLVKIAQHQIVKKDSEKPVMKTAFGHALMKLAEDLRSKSNDISVEDLENFLSGVRNAS